MLDLQSLVYKKRRIINISGNQASSQDLKNLFTLHEGRMMQFFTNITDEARISRAPSAQGDTVDTIPDVPNPLNGFGTVATVLNFLPLSSQFVPFHNSTTFDGSSTRFEFFTQLEDHFDLYAVLDRFEVHIAGSYIRGTVKEFYRRWNSPSLFCAFQS